MIIGKNFALIEILDVANDVNIVTATEERSLKIAKILQLTPAILGSYKTAVGDIVVVDATDIVYSFTDTECCIAVDGIICRYDIDTNSCVHWQEHSDSLVVKASIPDDETFLRNTYIQTGLVVIGGIQSDYSVPTFDAAVIITASPGSVKHLTTSTGDYYVTTPDNIIVDYGVSIWRNDAVRCK